MYSSSLDLGSMGNSGLAMTDGQRETAIRVENLSKIYHIYEDPRDRLKQFLIPRFQRLLGRSIKQYFREFWSIKDVSFEIKKGETVGIIGRNGSGKSTLLQIICGTLTPSIGSVEVRGRIAALLELGSGFNPDFTGRENVYLNASILGLSREETDIRFDEIASFADIGEFIEQPVRSYSSGMVVRLAFAVAINVDPEILVVDEALSVGDELFQRKCFSRIEDLKKRGTTILFVSHAANTIVELCDKAILIDTGELLLINIPKIVVGSYQKILYCPPEERLLVREELRQRQGPEFVNRLEDKISHATKAIANAEFDESYDPNLKSQSKLEYEINGAVIDNPRIHSVSGNVVNNLVKGRTYLFRYVVRFLENAYNVKFGMMIKTVSGIEIGGSTTALQQSNSIAHVTLGTVYNIEFKFNCILNPGVYFLNAGVMGVVGEIETFLHRMIDVTTFRVGSNGENDLSTGIIDFYCDYKLSYKS